MRKSSASWVAISLFFCFDRVRRGMGRLTENNGQIGVLPGQSFVTQQLEK
jgi:hypothetical protein